MAVTAYITRVKNVRKHSNADKLNVGECFGNSIVMGLDVVEGELGIYFPTDSKVGLEFATANKLVRTKDELGNHIYGYLEPDKLHITTLKLRGEKSDGLFMKLESLENFCNISTLKEGDLISVLNGKTICEKYVPRGKGHRSQGNNLNKSKVKIEKKESYPLFTEHIDTSQLAYNMGAFKEGDICYITLKMHGTSARTSYTIKETKRNFPYLVRKMLNLFNVNSEAKKSWEYVSGSRRVVLKNFDGGFYGNDDFRRKWHTFFAEKLQKGECAYYEIVSYIGENQLIMPECSNEKTKDKEFIKQWGKTTRFTYGCENGQNDIYVYRMTITNEDGFVVEMPWHLVKLRCEQMGIKCVPEFDKFLFTTQDDLMERVNKYLDGADPVGKTHIREGVVVRVDNKEKFTAYKHKSFAFKCLEGIVKADDIMDMEEAEDEKGSE